MPYVQLSEDSKTAIAEFSCPQDDDLYPNQAERDEDDQRYVKFLKLFSLWSEE